MESTPQLSKRQLQSPPPPPNLLTHWHQNLTNHPNTHQANPHPNPPTDHPLLNCKEEIPSHQVLLSLIITCHILNYRNTNPHRNSLIPPNVQTHTPPDAQTPETQMSIPPNCLIPVLPNLHPLVPKIQIIKTIRGGQPQRDGTLREGVQSHTHSMRPILPVMKKSWKKQNKLVKNQRDMKIKIYSLLYNKCTLNYSL